MVRIVGAEIEFHKVRLADLPSEESHRMIGIDLSSVFFCLKHQVPWVARKGGAIVNIPSTVGVRRFAQQSSYVVAKHGVIGLTKVAALGDVRDKARVNAIAPELTETKNFRSHDRGGNKDSVSQIIERIPLDRPRPPEEVASTFV